MILLYWLWLNLSFIGVGGQFQRLRTKSDVHKPIR